MSEAQPPLESPAGSGPFGAGPVPATATSDRPPVNPDGPGSGWRSHRTLIEWGAIILVAVLAAFLLRAFVIQPYYIPSGSMEPTLKVGDKVLVDKLSYHLHGIHRGDVIVFKRPAWDVQTDPNVKDLIKRVIGLPGETISAAEGHVFIDGKPLNEPWLPKGVTTSTFGPVVIPAGRYFVMGDNRGNSSDSRYALGPIPPSLIIGRAFVVVWPLGDWSTL